MAVSDAPMRDDVAGRLDQGLTLPADWYTDPDILALERKSIFQSAWRFAGNAEDVAEPGQYLTRQLGDVPVVVVRGNDGQLRGFVNVCRHRSTVIASGCGHAKSLQCPYHAWTFNLDGTLRAAPRSDREPDFDKSLYSLVPVQADTWGPLVFVNLDTEAEPLPDYLAAAASAMDATRVDFGRLRHHRTYEFDIKANWKIVAENYLECYHCPTAHPGFTKLVCVGPEDYRLRSEGSTLIAEAPARARRGRGAPKIDTRGDIEKTLFQLVCPGNTFNLFPGQPHLLMYWFEPISPTRTIGAFEYYFADDTDEEYQEDLQRFFDEVGNEDVALVEAVQVGLSSGMVPHGRVLPDSEVLIQRFHRYVYDAVTA